MRANATAAVSRLDGLIVEFDDAHQLVHACERVRDAGFTKWDAHSPFPVHGIDNAIGISRTVLPLIVFAGGLTGCLTGIALTWWTNAVDPRGYLLVPTFLQGYNFPISGKPDWSFPANIPIIFELTILFSAFAAVFGMLALNNLPLFYQALFRNRRFRRVTNDRFFISVSAADPKFDESETTRFLESLGGAAVERVEDHGDARLPQPLYIAGVLGACAALVPPAVVAKAWFAKSPEPRIHIIQDMDNQERFKNQQANPLFRDGRADRPPVPGTLARGDLRDDRHFFEGVVGNEWATVFPPEVPITPELLDRGEQRFNIYCAPCHGLSGEGADQGMVPRRAKERGSEWIVNSLVDGDRTGRPVGHIFNTISNGIRTMPSYSGQIPEADRWAIVSYVRALQRAHWGRLEDVPAGADRDLLQRSISP